MAEYKHLYDVYRERGYTGEEAFDKTVDIFISRKEREYRQFMDTRSRDELAADFKLLHQKCRNKKYSRLEAWERCEEFVEKVIKRHKADVDGSAFGDFTALTDSLPDSRRGSLYHENLRHFNGGSNHKPYLTEERTPSGASRYPRDDDYRTGRSQRYQATEPESYSPRYHATAGSYLGDSYHQEIHGRRYKTETRAPSGGSVSSRDEPHGSYSHTKSRAPKSQSSTYAHTSSSYPFTASSSSSCYPDSRKTHQTKVRTPRDSSPPPRGRTGNGRGAYRTEERIPQASSGSSFADSFSPRSPFPTSPRPSFTSREAPYESHARRARSPSPRAQPEGKKPPTCLYTVLGISSSASAEEIKKAYHKMSRKWHPDRCSAADQSRATDKMQEVNDARDILCDVQMRKFYDETGRIPGICDQL